MKPIFIKMCFVSLLCFCMSVYAVKTDIIILTNGDHITGEIKSLSAGQLELSTEYMDTVFIDWENIRDIISTQDQQVEMGDGRRLLGTLNKPQTTDPEDDDSIIIETVEGPQKVLSSNLVRMYPVGDSFWDRMDLSIGLGFNFDKSSSVGKYNLGVDAVYRASEFMTFGKLSSEITTQDTKSNTTRNVLNIDHMVIRKNRTFLNYFGSMEQNDQLGIQLRTLAGVGYGWVPKATNRNWISMGAGLAVNRENPLDGSESDSNLEAVGSFRYQYFRRGKPERTADIYFKVFPSLTQFGRVRADFTASAHWEIVRDFYIGMEVYSSFDGEPEAKDAAEIDYGFRTSVGMKF